MGLHTTEHCSRMILKLWQAHDPVGYETATQAWGSRPLDVSPLYPVENKSQDEHIGQARKAEFTKRADEVLNEIARLHIVIASMQLSQLEKQALRDDIRRIYQSNFGFIHKTESIELFKQLAARPKWQFLKSQHGFDVQRDVDVGAEFDLDDDDVRIKLRVTGRVELVRLRGTLSCHGIVKTVQRMYEESRMLDCDRKKDHAKLSLLMLLAQASGYQADYGYVLPSLPQVTGLYLCKRLWPRQMLVQLALACMVLCVKVQLSVVCAISTMQANCWCLQLCTDANWAHRYLVEHMRVGCSDQLTAEYRDTPYCRGAEANFDRYAGASPGVASKIVTTRCTKQQAINVWNEKKAWRKATRTDFAAADGDSKSSRGHTEIKWFISVVWIGCWTESLAVLVIGFPYPLLLQVTCYESSVTMLSMPKQCQWLFGFCVIESSLLNGLRSKSECEKVVWDAATACETVASETGCHRGLVVM